ncbi:MAG: heme o synthase [bacterium]|nr:heme o synthase [bacterium]
MKLGTTTVAAQSNVATSNVAGTWRDYFTLMKPSIMLLVLITGLAALIVEGSLFTKGFDAIWVTIGLLLTGGSANALNMYFERDRDAVMTRTRKRRPLPQGKIEPRNAFIFSVAIGVIAVAMFAVIFNWLSASLALFTILFYSLFYTLYLKPRTAQNIVIGGIAGAMAPPIAWAAMTGTVAAPAWIMFAIIVMWTPPHFWSLALFYKDDYVNVNYPMMPVVKGDEATRRQIFYYSLGMLGTSGLLLFSGASWFYAVSAIVLGVLFLRTVLALTRKRDLPSARKVFGYSILYLFVLFIAMMLDAGIQNLL